jgi:hypothetical protein
MLIDWTLTTFSFLSGDFLQRWTNDRWISPIHRVVGKPILVAGNPTIETESAPKLGDIDLSRKSIVFFSGPIKDVLIETVLSTHQDGSIEKLKYPPIKAGEHLRMKLNQTQVKHG